MIKHEYETLAEVAGLKNSNERQRHADIIKAHKVMKQISFMQGYEAGAKTITVTINHTPGQSHHIVKKIIKSRRGKKARHRTDAIGGIGRTHWGDRTDAQNKNFPLFSIAYLIFSSG